MTLILASQSTTRRTMLEAAGVPFTAVAAPLDEEAEKVRLRGACVGPKLLAERLAEAKALSVADRADILVLGCDQTLEHGDGQTFDKPRTAEEARAQLTTLAGTRHFLHAAAAIAENGTIIWRAVETVTLVMRPLGESFVGSYLAREYEAVRHNVGGYRIEGMGAQLFERIEGSHFAILGLPLLPLLGFLRTRGVLAT